MHISDMLGQYNRNVSNGTEELRSAQGVQKLVSNVGDLSAGSVFEGTVNTVKGGKVTLALGNGQVITARLDGRVDIKAGTAMFFQVKSNDGTTVSIRPYSGVGNISNPILLNALTAAQVPATDRTLTMVDAMMQEHMSVDRQSILEMAKVLNANPQLNVKTLVQMTKLGLPVSEKMAAQFENYLSNQHELLEKMELAVGQIAEVMGDEEMEPVDSAALYSKVLDAFTDNTAPMDGQLKTIAQLAADAMNMEETPEKNLTAQMMSGEQEATLGSLLSKEQLETLGRTVQNIPALAGNIRLFAEEGADELYVDTMQDDSVVVTDTMAADTEVTKTDAEVMKADAEVTIADAELASDLTKATTTVAKTELDKDMTAGEFLRTLQSALTQKGALGFSGVQKLFAGKEFQILLREVVQQQWLLEPKDVKDEKRILSLYEKLNQQLEKIETAVRDMGITENSFLQTASDIHGNVEFMNQMNRIYNYIQLPLKLSGQNTNGELYVYTNKKRFNDPDVELTAFLHLDMDKLGATDVSVRMNGRQVKTNFYFEDDSSYNLVEKHLPILEKRLKNKGYDCTVTIANEKRDVNFKENFVKKGQVTSGSVHRYSFDVRA